jgi:hypothetical protein
MYWRDNCPCALRLAGSSVSSQITMTDVEEAGEASGGSPRQAPSAKLFLGGLSWDTTEGNTFWQRLSPSQKPHLHWPVVVPLYALLKPVPLALQRNFATILASTAP